MTIDHPADAKIRDLLADRNYLFVWMVGGLTGVIRWFQLLALGVYTFEITDSPLLVSSVPVLWMLPLTLFGPAVGVIADRVDRKLLLSASIVMVIVMSIVMTVLAELADLTYLHVAVTSFISGLFWATDMPVRRRLIGDLSGQALSTAMSLDSATGNATRMAGPLLGGVMLQVVGMSGVFFVSAVLFAVCLALILAARFPETTTITAPPVFLRDMAAGIRFVAGDVKLRWILSVTIIFNLWGFPFTAMIPILGKGRLGLDPFMVGLLSSLEGLGALIGAMLIAVAAKPEIFMRIYVGGTLAYLSMIGFVGILSFVAGGPNHSFLAASATLTVAGIAGACFAAMQGTLTYLGAPPEYRSRVLGVLTLCIGMGPFGFLNVGLMAESFGVSTALVVISAEGLFALLVLWLFFDHGESTKATPES